MTLTAKVLTVSDGVADGSREDKSGVALVARLQDAGYEIAAHEVTRDGRRWISTTLVNGQSVMRMMVISYLTAHRHLEDLMIVLTEAVKKHAASQGQAGRSSF